MVCIKLVSKHFEITIPGNLKAATGYNLNYSWRFVHKQWASCHSTELSWCSQWTRGEFLTHSLTYTLTYSLTQWRNLLLARPLNAEVCLPLGSTLGNQSFNHLIAHLSYLPWSHWCKQSINLPHILVLPLIVRSLAWSRVVPNASPDSVWHPLSISPRL